MKTGIDLSHHNGNVDFDRLEIDFGILRIGYSNRDGQGGLNLDRKFERNTKGFNENEIPFGIYVYCYDETVEGAKKTASDVIEKLDEMKADGVRCEYPIYYDIEYGESHRYTYNSLSSVKNNTDMVIAFCDALEKAGYYCGIYASKNFFEYYLDMERLKKYDKWVACYTKSGKNPIKWAHGIWQKKSTGYVKGVNGNVDINESYKDYPAIIKKAGLNGFDTAYVKKYEVKIGPMSVGDRDSLISMSNILGLQYEVKEV